MSFNPEKFSQSPRNFLFLCCSCSSCSYSPSPQRQASKLTGRGLVHNGPSFQKAPASQHLHSAHSKTSSQHSIQEGLAHKGQSHCTESRRRAAQTRQANQRSPSTDLQLGMNQHKRTPSPFCFSLKRTSTTGVGTQVCLYQDVARRDATLVKQLNPWIQILEPKWLRRSIFCTGGATRNGDPLAGSWPHQSVPIKVGPTGY